MGYNSKHLKARVLNMPDYRANKYVVARLVKSQLWFYGSYTSLESAEACSRQLGDMSLILINEEDDCDDDRR